MSGGREGVQAAAALGEAVNREAAELCTQMCKSKMLSIDSHHAKDLNLCR